MHAVPSIRVSVVVGRTRGVNTLVASSVVETFLIRRTLNLLLRTLVYV